MKVEVCCADWESVLAAKKGGAERIELCENLEVGGVTPSEDLIKRAVDTGLCVHILIRARAGNFIYNEAEVETMVRQIERAKELGAKGVVWGALNEKREIDMKVGRILRKASNGVEVTFNRAFDECEDPLKELSSVMHLECDKLLTSGGKKYALAGVEVIRQLVEETMPFLDVMPASGVNENNILYILGYTCANEIHGSFRENGHTSAEKVRRVIDSVKRLEEEIMEAYRKGKELNESLF